MKIEEDRREGVVVFRCSGAWENRTDEVDSRLRELLVEGSKHFVFDLSGTMGADWLLGILIWLAHPGRGHGVEIRFAGTLTGHRSRIQAKRGDTTRHPERLWPLAPNLRPE